MAPANCDLDNLLTLCIDDERLSATLRVEATSAPEPISQSMLSTYLSEHDIAAQCILLEEIDRLIEAHTAESSKAQEAIVARGRPPVQPQVASIVYDQVIKDRIDQIAHRAQAQARGSDIDADDQAIDFHNESPFLIVQKGQLIGHLGEDAPGEPGFDISAKTIEINPNEGKDELLHESVELDDQGNVYALVAGRLIYDGEMIEVQSTLDIPANVDFNTGNIDFPGDVVIHEGVNDRFSVHAQGSIEISKLVQASTLIADQNIELKSGMAGREIGTITTQGDLHAKYLDGVHATIGGVCKVQKEITNCHITCAQFIDSPTTALRGGEIRATKGGVFGSIGSEQGVETEIIIGWLPDIEDKIVTAEQLLTQVKSTIAKLHQEYEMFKGSMGKANASQQAQLKEMEIETAQLTRQQGELESATLRLRQIIYTYTQRSLTVKSSIYAKSKLWLPGYCAHFDKDIRGELIIELDENNEPVITRNGQTTPLRSVVKVSADDRVLPYQIPQVLPETPEPQDTQAPDMPQAA